MSALQLGVVVDAQPSQVGHLFAAQAWHAPGTVALDHVEACGLWADLGPTRDQELSNLGPPSHPSKPKGGLTAPLFSPGAGIPCWAWQPPLSLHRHPRRPRLAPSARSPLMPRSVRWR